MGLPSISVRRPILADLLMILIIVAGVSSFRQMGREVFPEVSLEMVMVSAVLPGASPKEIEQLLTIPMEEQILKLDEIDNVRSFSRENVSLIMVQFEAGIENLFEKVTEIQNQIERVEHFPADAERPEVAEVKASFQTVIFSVLGDAPEAEVREYVRDLREELTTIPGVAEISVAGLREREIWVEIDPHRLEFYNLTLADVADALARRNLNLPGGAIRMQRGEMLVRTEAEYRDLSEIPDTILRRDAAGGAVYVRDVATVRDTFADSATFARLDGKPSITLTVNKQHDANAVDIVEAVRARTEAARESLPAGTEIVFVNDSSVEIRARLRSLFQNFAVGLVLVALAFTLAVGWRAAIVISAGLPVAFLGTFVVLRMLGHTLNELVLFSMILVLGLIVDDAIVVCENIYRHVESGMPLRRAAIFGAEQITAPVVATVMTTVAAFLPLLLMTGIVGKFMGVIPVVVCIALLVSLFEAFFILPAHVYEWSGNEARGGRQQAKRWLGPVLGRYRSLIRTLIRHRYLTVAAVVVLAFGCLVVASRMDFILFGGSDLESFAVNIEGPASASLHETDRIVEEIEARLLELGEEAPEIEFVRAHGGFMERGMDSISGSHVGQVSIDLVAPGQRKISGHDLLAAARRRLADVVGARSIDFAEGRNGPPVGEPIHVRVRGDGFDTLRLIANELKDFLRTIDGVEDVADSFPPGKDEVRPELDAHRLAAAGLSVREVAAEIRGAFDGIEATRIYDGNEEVEVVVKFRPESRSSIATLEGMRFRTPEGLIPFSNLGRLQRQAGVSEIHHHNGERSISVTADVDETVITSQRANELLLAHFADLGQRFPGYVIEAGGEFEDTQESLASLFRAFLLSVLVIYVILGGLFGSFVQPFVVMFSVPFAFVGVIVGFFVLDEPLGMASLIGTIALVGIVVNDSLILIDFINRRRREGLGLDESIIEATSTRLRPILLTSITTIAGLLPMSIGLFGVDQSLKPMAVAIGWGLTFATLLTLGVVPCVYRIVDDIGLRLFGRSLAAPPNAPAPGVERRVEAH